jgi:hypothetical protein
MKKAFVRTRLHSGGVIIAVVYFLMENVVKETIRRDGAE